MLKILPLCVIVVPAFVVGQTVTNADVAVAQPTVARDGQGFTSCGVHVVASSLTQDQNSSAYDFSVNLWDTGTGMMKAGRITIPFDKVKGWDVDKRKVSSPGPVSFWLARRDESAPLSPTKYILSDDPGYVLGGIDGIGAIKSIYALAAGDPMQVSLKFKGETYERVMAFKPKMTEDDQETLKSCVDGIVKRMAAKVKDTK